MMVTTLSRLKQQVHWPYSRLCASLGLPYGSFRRWQQRREHGQPALLFAKTVTGRRINRIGTARPRRFCYNSWACVGSLPCGLER